MKYIMADGVKLPKRSLLWCLSVCCAAIAAYFHGIMRMVDEFTSHDSIFFYLVFVGTFLSITIALGSRYTSRGVMPIVAAPVYAWLSAGIAYSMLIFTTNYLEDHHFHKIDNLWTGFEVSFLFIPLAIRSWLFGIECGFMYVFLRKFTK
jgi:hypothetical protein